MPRFVSRRGFYTAAALSGVTLLCVNGAFALTDGPPSSSPRSDGRGAEPSPFPAADAAEDLWGGGPEDLFGGGSENVDAMVFAIESATPVAPPERAESEKAARQADPDAVPGAEATETVLRCVYRPHPSRVQAIYEFLRVHAAEGVDVSLRSVFEETGEVARQVTYVATTLRTPRQVDPGETVYEDRTVMKPVGADGQAVVQEFVVVAPPETQRAVGAFLQLVVSAEPAPQDSASPPETEGFLGTALPPDADGFAGFGGPTFDGATADGYNGGFSGPSNSGDNPDGKPGSDGDLPFSVDGPSEQGGPFFAPDGFTDPLPADFDAPADAQPAGPPRG